MIEIQLKGFKELGERLKKLPENLRTKAVKESTKAAAIVMKKAIQEQTPILKPRPGHPGDVKLVGLLRKSIGYAIGRKHFLAQALTKVTSKNDVITYYTGLKKSGMHGVPVFYGHRVFRRGGQYHTLVGKYKSMKIKEGKHAIDYVEPNKFVTRAFDANIQRAINMQRVGLANAIEKYMRMG